MSAYAFAMWFRNMLAPYVSAVTASFWTVVPDGITPLASRVVIIRGIMKSYGLVRERTFVSLLFQCLSAEASEICPDVAADGVFSVPGEGRGRVPCRAFPPLTRARELRPYRGLLLC